MNTLVAPAPQDLVETPPAGTPSLKSFMLPSVEQVANWEAHQAAMAAHTAMMERQTQAMEAQAAKLTQQMAVAEFNRSSFERQAAAMELNTAEFKKMVAALAAPMKSTPSTTAEIVERLCLALSHRTDLTPTQVVDQARAIATRFRQFYPSVSFPAP